MGLLVAASPIAVSFLGQSALEPHPLLLLLALAAFATTIGAGLYVLLPTYDLVFALVGSQLFETLTDFSDDIEEVHRRLAFDLDGFWRRNDRAVRRVVLGSRVAASAFGAEVVLLLASVGGNLG
jgi:hypothetical protein